MLTTLNKRYSTATPYESRQICRDMSVRRGSIFLTTQNRNYVKGHRVQTKPFDCKSVKLYLRVIATFALCRHLRSIRNRNVHNLDLDLYNGPRSNVDMPIETQFMRLFDGNSKVCRISHHLSSIKTRSRLQTVQNTLARYIALHYGT